MSSSKVIRWAGLSVVLAGALSVVFPIIHPPDDPSSVATSSWAIAHYIVLGWSIFALLGISGIYARQVEEAGWLGLVGFLTFFVGLALLTSVGFLEAIVMPLLASEAPQSIAVFFPGEGLGVLDTVRLPAGLVWIVGGLLFGISIIRAGILPRWAAILFVIGTASLLLAAVLPEAVGRFISLPAAVGLAWLGYALWSEGREKASEPAPSMQS